MIGRCRRTAYRVRNQQQQQQQQQTKQTQQQQQQQNPRNKYIVQILVKYHIMDYFHSTVTFFDFCINYWKVVVPQDDDVLDCAVNIP